MGSTVGFDATAAARQKAGIGRYTRELLRALSARSDDTEYSVYYCAGGLTENLLPPVNGRFRVRAIPVSDRIANAVWHRARLPIPVQLLTGPIDLFHSPDFTLPPVLLRPSIVTVLDLAFLRRPECAYPTLRVYLEQVVPRSVRRATHIIAISESTRRDLIDVLDVPPDKVTAIPLAASDTFVPVDPETAREAARRLGITQPFILSVGTLEPRKNNVRLLEAFAELRRRGVEQSLVIAGGRGWMYEPVFERLNQLGLEDRVTFVNPSDQGLACLYSACDAFVYPSLYEGFGIPPLEALSCGAAVACSDTSSLPEVVGDAALTFDPESVEEIADSIERLLREPELHDELRRRGPARAAQFSWAETARRTERLYHEVAGAA